MGLDMYLTKRHYVKNWNHRDEKFDVSVKVNGEKHPGIKPENVSYITEEVGYWRKANHIHNWFVENVQGGVDECQESYVERSQLIELMELCKLIKEDPSSASTALPTVGGFFFGDEEYDKYYFDQIDQTIEILENELEMNQLEGIRSPEYYYQSSW